MDSERTWILSIHVTDLSVEKRMRVSGDLHMGGVMFQLVESLAVSTDWSDHSLWWPAENKWLNNPKATLNQYGVQAEAKLQFTPMHKNMRVQLPDLQLVTVKLDFSCNVFSTIVQLCKEIGVRHPEELSFLLPADTNSKDGKNLDKKGFNQSTSTLSNRESRTSSSSNGSLNKPSPNSPFHTPQRTPLSMNSPSGTPAGVPGSWVNGMSPMSITRSLSFDEKLYSQLVHSPNTPTKEAMLYIKKMKTLLDKSQVNGGWLNSNKSLMEQAIQESNILHLRYKYYSFLDLNPKYDPVRINQIFEQSKWSLISEEVECTEEEMIMFAALQLHIQSMSGYDETDLVQPSGDTDEIDAALNDLQVSLQGSNAQNTGDIDYIPELAGFLKYFKPKKYTLKGAKKYYACLRDTTIHFYKSQTDMDSQSSVFTLSLRGAEVQPDVNLTQEKFTIKLFIPGPEGMSEEWLKFERKEDYTQWMAACKVTSKGRTMADASYRSEVQNIQQFMQIQKPSSSPLSTSPLQTRPAVSISEAAIDPTDFMAARFLKKGKSKMTNRILEAHENVRHMSLSEAKMKYITAWQSLPEYGLTYFLVKFRNSKKEEIVGIGANKLVRINPKTSEVTKTYRFNTMKSWSVHWENAEVIVEFEEEKLAIKCLSANCSIFHEFIGGYIFLSMQAQDKNQALNEDTFRQLTVG